MYDAGNVKVPCVCGARAEMSTVPANRQRDLSRGRRPERVTPETLEAAAARLIGATGGPIGKAAAQRFIASAHAQNIDLARFWIVRQPRGKRILAAALLAPSSGGTGMLFTSDPRNADEGHALGEAVDAVCAAPEGVRLAQSLLEPDQRAIRRIVDTHGFRHVGDLRYMRRDWAPLPPASNDSPLPAGVTMERWREGDDDELMRALERTYIDTLDCPSLCGVRRTEDVLASHRGAGEWRPELWWIIRVDDRAEGVALVNEFPDQGHAELVYLGLGPELRGRRLSSTVLRTALRPLEDRSCRDVTCAVDERNAPARALYLSHAFIPFAQRVALVRPVGD